MANFQLLKAEDGTKDQSYFLYRLNQAQLSKTCSRWPISTSATCARWPRPPGCTWRQEGFDRHLLHRRAAVQGVSLARYLPPKKGEIRRLDDGKVMGEHDGLMFHTMGQRKGLHIGGIKEKGQAGGGDHDAWFVAGKDMEKNVLYVVQGHDHPALLRASWSPSSCPGFHRAAPHTHWVYTAKPRYRTSRSAVRSRACRCRDCESASPSRSGR
jgi:tRNA-specific 2-thiouridylase